MERQGTCIHNHVNSRQYVGASMHVLVFFAVFFFFVDDGWGDCLTRTFSLYCSGGSASCSPPCPSNLSSYNLSGTVSGQGSASCSGGTVSFTCSGESTAAFIRSSQYHRSCSGWDYSASATFSVTYCSDPCEAEREYCLSQELEFDADSCKCKLPCPDDVCDTDRQRCEQGAKGNFTGRCVRVGGEPCCTSTCDICNSESQKKMQQEAIKVCCGNGLAPPKTSDVCGGVPPSGKCGMNWSYVSNEFDSQWKCRDPNGNAALQEWFYEACYGGSSSSTSGSSDSGGSSGEGGGSSGEGGGSSGGTPPYPEGCDECPWLDSILDTLTAQKGLVEQIYLCVKYPSLCDIGEDSQQIEIDSNILNGVKDLIDSNLELSREQIEKLLKLDTNLLKMLINDTTALKLDSAVLKLDSALLRLDSALLNSDSNTRKAIIGGLGSLDSTTDALNDSTRKWLKRIADSASAAVDSNRKYLEMVADSIGITAESLKVHLDSIKNAIPKDILDSILKYQKEGSNDSIVISSLPGLDSILDSTVSYWKKSQKADSARHLENNDTARAIHEAIDGIGVNIGAVLGYGDTATSDLHEDMLNVKGSILGFLDSALKYWQERHTFDSSYRESVGQSIVDVQGSVDGVRTSVDSSTRAISGVRDAVGELRDSSIKYLKEVIRADSSYRVQFGEKMGDVQDAVNAVEGAVNNVKGSVDGMADGVADIKGMLSEGSYDTSTIYDGYLNGYDTSAVKFVSDVGVAVSGAMNDTTYRGIFVQGSASSSEIGGYALPNIDSAHQVLKASVDSTYNALGTDLEGKFDTLKKEFVLINWDSAIVAPLGMKVPNTNTCPEDCFVIDLSSAGSIFSSVNALSWGVCNPWSVLAGMNALEFVRLILRIVTAVTCVTLGMWFIAGRRN